MAWAQGDFTASTLANIKDASASIFDQSVANRRRNKKLSVHNEMAGRQIAQLNEQNGLIALTDFRNCAVTEAVFLQDGNDGLVTQAVFDSGNDFCNPTGTELGSQKITLSTAHLAYDVRKVVHNQCKDMHDYTVKMAEAIESLKYSFDNYLESSMLSVLDAAAGDHTAIASYISKGFINVDPSIWDLSVADADVEFIADLSIAVQAANWTNPVLVTGTHYTREAILSMYKNDATPNADQILFQSIFGQFAHNVIDVDATIGQKGFYVADAASFVYINSTEFDMMPQSPVPGETVFTLNSDRLTWNLNGNIVPVKYDFKVVRKCTDVGLGTYADVIVGRVSGGYTDASSIALTGDAGIAFKYHVNQGS